MSEKTHTYLSLYNAIAALNLGESAFFTRAQVIGARLLFPVPGRKLQFAIRPEKRWDGTIRKSYLRPLALKEVDYVVPDSRLLVKIYQNPQFLLKAISQIAQDQPVEAKVRLRELRQCVKEIAGHCIEYNINFYLGNFDIVVFDENVRFDLREINILQVDFERMQGLDAEKYQPGVEDFGEFRPGVGTTQMVRDLNTGYYLFKVKFPFVGGKREEVSVVRAWLYETWKGRDIGARITDEAAALVVHGDDKFDIGGFTIRSEVRSRHHAGTPNALMLIDQFAQDKYIADQRGERPEWGEPDFRTRAGMNNTLSENITRSKYRDLVIRAASSHG